MHTPLVMAVHIQIPQKKVGPIKFGPEKTFKLKLFPFVVLIKETHLIGTGFMSKPITRNHERWVKVLNEHEVYVFKNSLNGCHICENYYGMVKTENINLDPHIGKIFSWLP